MSSLKFAILQQRPFTDPCEEAFLALLYTADSLQRAFYRQIRSWGLTGTQYNVLRILRGAQPGGLTCAEIGSRMITAVPDITRLLARLNLLGFIRQHRDTADRRIVWTHIAPAGLDLLERMDPIVAVIPGQLLGHLDQAEITHLIALLEAARSGNPSAACDPSSGCPRRP